MDGNQLFIMAIVAGLPGIITACTGFLVVLQKIREVHQIVNSQRTEMQREISELKNSINERHLADVRQEREKSVEITKTASEMQQTSPPS